VIITAAAFWSCAGGQKRNHDNPDYLHQCRRPGRVRPCRQSRPAGWQPHRLQRPQRRADPQAARAVLRAGPPGRRDRPANGPEQ
jgi:hypothetical protein